MPSLLIVSILSFNISYANKDIEKECRGAFVNHLEKYQIYKEQCYESRQQWRDQDCMQYIKDVYKEAVLVERDCRNERFAYAY